MLPVPVFSIPKNTPSLSPSIFICTSVSGEVVPNPRCPQLVILMRSVGLVRHSVFGRVAKNISPSVELASSVSWKPTTDGAMHASSAAAGHVPPFTEPMATHLCVSVAFFFRPSGVGKTI